MGIAWIEPGDRLEARRGEVVVCIPVYGGHELFVRCLASVLAHTEPAVPILVCDDASTDERSAAHVRELEPDLRERRLFYLRQPHNVGFPRNANAAFATAHPADVVLLNSDCVVAEGWLDGLRAAALSDSRVATATALTNHGTIVSVPDRGRPSAELPPGWTLDAAAAVVRDRSLRLHPRIPSGIGHCLYVRRGALELVGDFDPVFSPGYGEEVDFSQRCLRSGLSHVVADDVFVLHQGGGSFSVDGEVDPRREEHERIIAARYPYYHAAIRELESDVSGPLARSLGAVRRALSGLRVVIDGRVLTGPITGTQVHVLEVIGALARTGQAELTVIVQPALGDQARRVLQAIDGITVLPVPTGTGVLTAAPADVFHRPFQVSSPADLLVATRLGERLVLTQQDMIAFHNPSYFSSYGRWHEYRGVTRRALGLADHVVFISEHARADALAEDLLEPERASVVPNGVDRGIVALDAGPPRPPRPLDGLPAGIETMLCLGTDFRHKNRLFALRLVEELQRSHDWDGRLVLAGPHVSEGSSTGDEAGYLSRHPRVAAAVIEVAAVSEAEKRWLLERARVMLYPTVHEGFGLIPFESMQHGVPCMWAPGTSLAELLPDMGGIVPWDVAQSARNALALMRDPDVREANLEAIRAAAGELTWDRAARDLLAVYEAVCDRPAAPLSSFERRHEEAGRRLSDDAMRLVGPGGALPGELERPLLALATHPRVSAPVFGAVKLGYRIAFRMRRHVADSAPTPRRGAQEPRERSTSNW